MLYRITCPVKIATGTQTYTVEAKSAEEALRKHKAGESEYEDEDIEVYSLGTPEVEKVEFV